MNYDQPIVIGSLAAGNQPLSDFDTDFDAVSRMGTLMCAAVGTNTVTLTALTNYPSMVQYGNIQKVGFICQNNTTGPVVLGVTPLALLNAYKNDGSTQINNGDMAAGAYYEYAYNSTLNSSAGGFQLISSIVSASPSFTNLTVNNLKVNSVATITTLIATSTVSLTIPLPSNSGGTGYSAYTNGQLLIGNSTGGTLTAATLVGGSGISITNSGGAVTITATGNNASGLTLLTTINATTLASIVFNSTYITNAYNKYQIEYDSAIGSSSTSDLNLTTSINGGTSYLAGGYYVYLAQINSSGLNGPASSNAPVISLTAVNSTVLSSVTTATSNGTIKFSNPSQAAVCQFAIDIMTSLGARYTGIGYNTLTSIVNTIRLMPASGNISGNFHLYGIAGT